jgi:hypothetical protein
MSASLACMAPALSSATRLERAVRWLFVGGSIACVAALVWFLTEYGHARGYLLEVSLVSIVAVPHVRDAPAVAVRPGVTAVACERRQ